MACVVVVGAEPAQHMYRGHHDTLLGNAEIVTDDKDAQIESKACNVNNMSDDDPVSLDPVSRDVRDEHDVLRDEQRADPTLDRAWEWAQKKKKQLLCER